MLIMGTAKEVSISPLRGTEIEDMPRGTGEILSLVIVPSFQGQLARKIKSIIAAKERYSQMATPGSIKMMTRGGVFLACFCECGRVTTANPL